MSSPQLPVQLPPPGFGWADVQPWLFSIVTLVAGWFGAQYTAFAKLMKTTLDASRLLVEDSQTLHARDNVRILELEAEVIRMRGIIRSHQQWEESLSRWSERGGHSLPKRKEPN